MVKMEKLLVIWMTDLHQRKFPVGMKMTQTKALILYESVKKNLENKTEKEIDETFSASNGRFHKFLSRTGIKNINLSFCVSITDTGLKSLAKMPNLEAVNLRTCDNVSDLGIGFLAENAFSY